MSRNKQKPLEMERDAILKEIGTLSQDTAEYGIMVENLKKLNEAIANNNAAKVKQLQFSQRIVWYTFLFSISIVLIVLGCHVLLVFLGFEGLSQEFITVVTVYGGITSGLSFTAYALLQGWRDNSLNKYCEGKRDDDSEPKG